MKMVAADPRDTHFVDIPLHDCKDKHGREEEGEEEEEELRRHRLALRHHPLKEISDSPGHLLLLKLWQREEDLSSRRMARKEALMVDSKREAFRLCSLFFGFHALFLTVLFTSSVEEYESSRACGSWWVPGVLSVATSAALVCAVQARVCRFWRASRDLQRERGDARALQRCVQELRMKGRCFDLSKEPQAGTKNKRKKSSSVEVRWWRPMGWCFKNLLTVFLLCFAGLALPACKLLVCG